MMFASLRARLWLSYALVVAAALGMVGVALFVLLRQSPLVYRDASARLLVARQVIDRAPSEEWLNDGGLLRRRIAALDSTFGTRVLVFDAERTLLADSRPDAAALMAPHLLVVRNFALIRDAQRDTWIYTLFQPLPQRWLMLAVPRPRLSALNLLRDDLIAPLLGAGLAGLALALLMAYLISRWVADPLQQVIAASQRMPEDDARPLPMRGPREVQQLLQAFNAMMARVQASQRAQRMFVANVSHELKTPLTSIQGFAQALLDDTAATPEARRQAVQVIYDESARMYRMVLDLLDLARIDSGMVQMKRDEVDVLALLRSIAQKFTPQARAGNVSLSLDVPPLPGLIGDGDRLAQVFANLLDNAIKFTPAGGVVSIRGEVTPNGIEIQVTDSGPGIPEDQTAQIFERFYQVDPSRAGGGKRGAGLGLSIAQEIVHAHGGKITVRSVHGQGSTFTVSLPLGTESVPFPARRK